MKTKPLVLAGTVLSLFVSVHVCAQFLHFATETVPVGPSPVSVIAVDVTGNGKLDLVSANAHFLSGGSGTLTVLTNNGSGIFGSNATYSAGSGTSWVAAADVNGDGHVDLISANSAGNTLTVLTNDGHGVFGSNATLIAGSGPNFVAVADVNGNSYPDLITANLNDNTLTVLTNNGSGIFGSNATYSVGPTPFCVAAADVNGDGYVDLISADYNFAELTVLTNNGSGVFGYNATYNVGSGPRFVVAADLNGTGKVDLISANWGASSLTILTNNGRGSFGFNATLNAGVGPQGLVTAHLLGDGNCDLVCADNYNIDTLTVLLSRPTLNINRSSNRVDVSWPSSWTNWALQQNSDLTTTAWSASGGISNDGTNMSLNFTSPTGQLFFRLIYPQ